MSNENIIPLHNLKKRIWKDVKSFIKRGTFPSVHRYIVGDGDEPPRIQVNLTKGDYFQPDKIFVEIQLQNYKCMINGKTGVISAIFEIPDIEIDDCKINSNLVNVDYVSDEFWECLKVIDIEEFVTKDWNN